MIWMDGFLLIFDSRIGDYDSLLLRVVFVWILNCDSHKLFDVDELVDVLYSHSQFDLKFLFAFFFWFCGRGNVVICE